MSLVEIDGLRYRYPGGREPALDGVDLVVEEGEMVILAGLSASGKSTLLRAAAGLVPHFYGGEICGRVSVAGLDSREHGPGDLAAVAASLFQEPETQVVMGTVRGELQLPLESRGWDAAAIARAVEETALALGIADLLDRPTGSLSGGELQRVALAAALVPRPRLLLLDEPASQLDPVAGDELVWQLRRLNEEWGMAVVLAEHRLERSIAAAGRVVVLDRGRAVLDVTPRQLAQAPLARRQGLVPPVTEMFVLAGVEPPALAVKDGRALLRRHGLADGERREHDAVAAPRRRRRFGRRRDSGQPALELRGVWVGYGDGSGVGIEALRGIDLRIEAGESVALLGRNGAGKSTLLRVAAGVREPDRGSVRRGGAVALVLQSPSDYFLAERLRDELPAAVAQPALDAVGLGALADADPRDLSGGERERLALAIVLAGRGIGGGDPPAVVALDEPTRGMDRARKRALADAARDFAARGAAVLVATHDVEFAARCADRCVLLGRGDVIADGGSRQLLAGGRWFTTDVARVLGPAAAAVLPEEGAAELARRRRAAQAAAADAGALGALL